MKEEGVDPLADDTGSDGKKVDGSGDLVTNHCHHTTLVIRRYKKVFQGEKLPLGHFVLPSDMTVSSRNFYRSSEYFYTNIFN